MAILVRKVGLRNYKSIAECDVDLSDLTILVGRNGAGKSNFVDALRLTAQSLQSGLEYAIRERGGIGEVRRRSGGHPNHFAISLRIKIDEVTNGLYHFQIGAQEKAGFYVQREEAVISHADLTETHFRREKDSVVDKSEDLTAVPRVVGDAFLLAQLSGNASMRPLYEALTGMTLYNINPAAIRVPQRHDRGDVLEHSGLNIAGVIKRLRDDQPDALDRIQTYLSRIVPGIESVEYASLRHFETLEFRQKVQENKHPWMFPAAAMSDGTLRSLGVLAALFQFKHDGRQSPSLVAIEEPESTIHPAAAAVLMGALEEASVHAQVLVTTHSPDLLDTDAARRGSLLAVASLDGVSNIAPVDEAALSAIQEGLYTPGELLRQDQLQPKAPKSNSKAREPDLFGSAR